MISVVVPVFNEQETIPELYTRLTAVMQSLSEPYEVIVVDDGSTDRSLDLLKELNQKNQNWKVLAFSRNFGHQRAISAGLTYAKGQAVAVMDGDLQDPPEELPRFLECINNGNDVVYAVRRQRKESLVKRICYRFFYRILNRFSSIDIPLDSGDFCVMSRRVVNRINELPERIRFVRGMRAWVGFKQMGLEYERKQRYAGAPKYTFGKLVNLAITGILSFSRKPLRLASYLGVLFCISAMLVIVLITLWWFSGITILNMQPRNMLGWTSLFSLILFVSGIQMLLIGFVGEYLGTVFDEVKDRPVWVIDQTIGFE